MQRIGLFLASLVLAFLLVAAWFVSVATARTALVRSGLFDDFGVFSRPVEDGLKKQGYAVKRIPWWASKSGSFTIEVGHSKGADRVLADGGRRVIAIDPTIANQGCKPKSDCTVYYGPANKFPLIFCCGGYPARGAKNIKIGWGHLQAPQIALSQILKQTSRLK